MLERPLLDQVQSETIFRKNYQYKDSRTPREVIGRLLDTRYALVKSSISTEIGVQETVLESGWILEIQVDLAIQAGICDGNSRANGGNEIIKDEGEPRNRQ